MVFRKAIIWMIFSIAIQLMILSYVNSIYLTQAKSVVSVNVSQQKPATSQDVGIIIPDRAIKTGVSYDGVYCAYVIDGMLELVELTGNHQKKIISKNNGNVDYFRWLPDRNMLIYGQTAISNKAAKIQIFTYDADSQLERKYPVMEGLSTKSLVEDIELSTMTNLVYAKVKVDNKNSAIYKFNIMNDMNYIMTVNTSCNVLQFNNSDKLAYESNNVVYIYDGMKKRSTPVPIEKKIVLLGINAEDKLYLGELDKNNKVVKVYSSKVESGKEPSWPAFYLEWPVSPTDITVTSSGTVFVIDRTQKSIYSSDEKTWYEYTGELVGIDDESIQSLDNGRIVLKKFKTGQTSTDTEVKNSTF